MTLSMLAALSLTGCAGFDEWQRLKVYRPTPVDAAVWSAELGQQNGASAQRVDLPGGEHIQLVRFPADPPAPPPAHEEVNVLYLHGTLRHVMQNAPKIDAITRQGLSVLAPDYRGFGASSYRVPDEASLREDVWAAWGQAQLIPGPWVIYGHSMGSALAVELAVELAQSITATAEGVPRYCALVLESAFTSFDDVARAATGFLGPLVTSVSSQKMPSLTRIPHVHGPVWMMHGANDRTVPMELGERLFAAAPSPKHWLSLPKGHSDVQSDSTGAYDAVWQQVRNSCLAFQSGQK